MLKRGILGSLLGRLIAALSDMVHNVQVPKTVAECLQVDRFRVGDDSRRNWRKQIKRPERTQSKHRRNPPLRKQPKPSGLWRCPEMTLTLTEVIQGSGGDDSLRFADHPGAILLSKSETVIRDLR